MYNGDRLFFPEYRYKEIKRLIKRHKSIKPQLSKKNLQRAKKILFDVVDLLEGQNIGYHLEGGTLLGMVRDNGILPWTSIPKTMSGIMSTIGGICWFLFDG